MLDAPHQVWLRVEPHSTPVTDQDFLNDFMRLDVVHQHRLVLQQGRDIRILHAFMAKSVAKNDAGEGDGLMDSG